MTYSIFQWRTPLLLVFIATCQAAMAADGSVPQADIFLDDLADTFTSTQSWGRLGVNTASYASDAVPMPLRIADKLYERGLGHHASGEIIIPLQGNYSSFTADVGVQWQGGGRGSVVFEVLVDGEQRFKSGVMTDSDAAHTVEIELHNAHELRLVAHDGGDGISHDMANWAGARLARDARIPGIGAPIFSSIRDVSGRIEPMEGSHALYGSNDGVQFAFSRPLNFCTTVVPGGESAYIKIPLHEIKYPFRVQAQLAHVSGAPARVRLSLQTWGAEVSEELFENGTVLDISREHMPDADGETVYLGISATRADTAVRLTRLQLISGDRTIDLNYLPQPADTRDFPLPRDIAAHHYLTSEIVEWDWRLQDGIGAGLTRSTFAAAATRTLAKGDLLLEDLRRKGVLPDADAEAWKELHHASRKLRASGISEDAPAWKVLWRKTHVLRRRMMFMNPLADIGPVVFAKHAPAVFSHQLTQYYGRYARPGGGIYVVEELRDPMRVRRLDGARLPPGSYMQPEVTHDGQRILFAFCAVDAAPQDTMLGADDRYYHLYEITRDGASLRQLTDGPYDDFSPLELPDGNIMLISTRRGGWHRCGGIGCRVYTLALMDGDGKNIRTISYHETQEWDPAVLNDGRVIYTRWDYVDRDAVHYQQLWVKHPDGSAPLAFYGNHTLNPVGVWEARAIPGARKVMATAAAHHAMTAGSIILVDPTVGIDGMAALTRLTPHVPFPESEGLLRPHWRTAVVFEPPERSAEMERWPDQSYRSPWPLSERYFLASYSFDPLIGEPHGNAANMFGLYLVDAVGNKELIYRDLNVSSLWPVPLRPREPAPALPSTRDPSKGNEGTYYLQNVYESYPPLPDVITRLRIVQVLPKTTPISNTPTVGAANASPGKQVLGTVPVEPDGSAYFRAPAGVSLSFQALDAAGRAVQIMRSASYLQPGEQASCVGCHEPRLGAPPLASGLPMAMNRPPSQITPGPDGSLPFSYPLLVQPVLDKHCVGCHGAHDAEGPPGRKPIHLTGSPEGRYTQSYNALVERVSFAAWGRGPFPEGNSEPTTQPDFFGARGSALAHMLLNGHQGVQLDAEDLERLFTWMDANALFYGTFNFADQERQQRGERISGPDLE